MIRETWCVMGVNGAGKSTLLKLLTGIYRPDRGRIEKNGKLASLIELGAGFHPDFSGRENVILNGIVLGMSKREVLSRFDEIVAFSELSDFIDEPVRTYSSGMYMRLAFSVAARRPRYPVARRDPGRGRRGLPAVSEHPFMDAARHWSW